VRVFTLHTGWLGVVTGISAASTGGILVSVIIPNIIIRDNFHFTFGMDCAVDKKLLSSLAD